MVNYKSIKLSPGLYFVSTPIGTARDITLRALDILASVDVLAAEDTRTLKKLLEIHGIQLKNRTLISYHDHNGSKIRPKILDYLEQGKNVTSAPGPCALIAALTIGGLSTDKFYFEGFLPNNKNQRELKLRNLNRYSGTLVFYESPKRLKDTLEMAVKIFGEKRLGVVCREITKKFEDAKRGNLKELSEFYRNSNVKGEIVILIDGMEDDASELDLDQTKIEAHLKEALKSMSVKDSAETVSIALNLPRRDVYQLALRIKSSSD